MSVAEASRVVGEARSEVAPGQILFVVGALQVGGTEQHLSMIARSLNQRGWQTSVYCLTTGGPLQAELDQSGIPVVLPPIARPNRPLSLPDRIFRLGVAAGHLLTVMLRRRPTIVHFFLPQAYLTGAPLAVLARIPVRVMSRRSLNAYQDRHPVLRAIEHRMHRTMTAILGNSRSVVRELQGEGVPADRLGLIYNGLDPTRFEQTDARAAMRESLGIPPSALVMVIVANLIPYKGHLDLLHALGAANASLPDWRLLVVGRDDGAGASIRAAASKLGIDQKVLLLGQRLDVPEILSSSDIGLLVSHEEGFSNALLEGMAAGLPMIVTDVGGNREAVVDGESGLVVPPHDPKQLCMAILRLAGDAALRGTLGAAARRRIAERFTIDRCIEGYEALYRKLLAGGRPKDVPGCRLPE
jgi:glycosyltransferase involved in cell wall biosynthesis